MILIKRDRISTERNFKGEKKMVKCKNGHVKIHGDAGQITAEMIVLLSEVMEALFDVDCKEGLDEFEETIVGIAKSKNSKEKVDFLIKDAKKRVFTHTGVNLEETQKIINYKNGCITNKQERTCKENVRV